MPDRLFLRTSLYCRHAKRLLLQKITAASHARTCYRKSKNFRFYKKYIDMVEKKVYNTKYIKHIYIVGI